MASKNENLFKQDLMSILVSDPIRFFIDQFYYLGIDFTLAVFFFKYINL